jgi:predicted MFS family arabinose efflux permease
MKEKKKKDPWDGEYIGNLWGWRFSLIGLALIVAMVGIMVYRHYTLGVPFGAEQPERPEVSAPDSVVRDMMEKDTLK